MVTFYGRRRIREMPRRIDAEYASRHEAGISTIAYAQAVVSFPAQAPALSLARPSTVDGGMTA
jgi:hypothetical protein